MTFRSLVKAGTVHNGWKRMTTHSVAWMGERLSRHSLSCFWGGTRSRIGPQPGVDKPFAPQLC